MFQRTDTELAKSTFIRNVQEETSQSSADEKA
eukprot:CAMPEP_0198235478 /NCGR_PEP_ID=MMETSP1446-20131203/1378_1 /TAXON_ID=1461542 ORGANISM="Unidentified sp, Strain CCMP2111" /NCGR_SAMPLE_ID=MMETSP1446 /ASSEMBLY_ACC=CAM_ASM_001112 /LENGTH=31 /DNA_ID= /DNA_START= /DNA_END= /DNA_ORIENTATION=